jgi:hypothetical protein
MCSCPISSQIAKNLDEFLPRLTEVDFVPSKVNGGVLLGRKYECKWITHSLLAADVTVPETHAVQRLVELSVRATVLQVSERRAILSFVQPDNNQSSKALLITPNFSPATYNLTNVIKYRCWSILDWCTDLRSKFMTKFLEIMTKLRLKVRSSQIHTKLMKLSFFNFSFSFFLYFFSFFVVQPSIHFNYCAVPTLACFDTHLQL